MATGVAAALLVVGLLIGGILGFYFGTRGRQLIQSMKAAFSNLPAIPSLRVPKEDPADTDEGKDDAENLNEDAEEDLADIINHFLNREPVSGLDDHPELELSPVLMYQIKQAKAAKRAEMYANQLREEGLTQEEIDEKMAGGETGASIPQGRPNAFSILIMAGARVTPPAEKGNSDQMLIQERRRQARTIDVFLSKERQIDTAKEPVAREKHILGTGQQGKMSALQMAEQTKDTQTGPAARSTQMVGVATRGRNLLRERKSSLRYKYVKPKKEDKDGETKKQRGGVQLDESDLAALAAEFEAEEEAGKAKALLGEEGEEGEEGYGYLGGGYRDDDELSEDSGYFGKV